MAETPVSALARAIDAHAAIAAASAASAQQIAAERTAQSQKDLAEAGLNVPPAPPAS
jgi:hypothetical protein